MTTDSRRGANAVIRDSNQSTAAGISPNDERTPLRGGRSPREPWCDDRPATGGQGEVLIQPTHRHSQAFTDDSGNAVGIPDWDRCVIQADFWRQPLKQLLLNASSEAQDQKQAIRGQGRRAERMLQTGPGQDNASDVLLLPLLNMSLLLHWRVPPVLAISLAGGFAVGAAALSRSPGLQARLESMALGLHRRRAGAGGDGLGALKALLQPGVLLQAQLIGALA